MAEDSNPALLRRAKIVATLGPATDDIEVLTRMMRAGLDVARLNASHGTAEDRRRRMALVREAARACDKCVGILMDLSGPKIRIECFRDGRVLLAEGAPFTLDTALDPKGGSALAVGVAYKDLPRDVAAGDTLLLADGQIVLDVLRVAGTGIETRVRVGGELSDRKGLNRQGGGISAPALSERDRDDISFAAAEGIDYLAVSFARDAADIEQARTLLRAAGGEARIVAKIERHEAIDNLAGIIDAADVVMVARGDLGVEMGYAELTGLQKTIIHQTRIRNQVVITATQMMESMIQNPVPTRAEVSDVANAVMDGTDAVMLSAETATGRYPVRAVQAMAQVIEGAEKYELIHNPHAPSQCRGPVQGHRGSDRDGGDVHRQSHEGARHRRADRVGGDAVVDVAHPRRHAGVCVHAPRGDAPPRHAVPRGVPGDLQRHRSGQLDRCALPCAVHPAARAAAGQDGRPGDHHQGRAVGGPGRHQFHADPQGDARLTGP